MLPITEKCLELNIFYQSDAVRNNQFFLEFADKYPVEVLQETFTYTLKKMQENQSKIHSAWGYFKKVFAGEIWRINKEYLSKKPIETVVKAIKETNQSLFAQSIMCDYFMSQCNQEEYPKQLDVNDEDYSIYEDAKNNKLTDDQLEAWCESMRAKGFGRSFDTLTKEKTK